MDGYGDESVGESGKRGMGSTLFIEQPFGSDISWRRIATVFFRMGWTYPGIILENI